jgi:hypothetical protein
MIRAYPITLNQRVQGSSPCAPTIEINGLRGAISLPDEGQKEGRIDVRRVSSSLPNLPRVDDGEGSATG